jgi:hypothetical protein
MIPNEAAAQSPAPEGENWVTQFPPQPRLRVVRELDQAEANVETMSARVADAIEKNKPKPKARKKASPKPKAAKVDPIVQAAAAGEPPVELGEEQELRTREEAYEALFDPHDAPPAPVVIPPKRSSWFRRFVSSFSLMDDSDEAALRTIAVREPIVPIYLGIAGTVFLIAGVLAWFYG